MIGLLLSVVTLLAIAPLCGRRETTDVLSPAVVAGGAVFGFVTIRVIFILLTNYSGILGFEASPLRARQEALETTLIVVTVGLSAFYGGYALLARVSARSWPHFQDRWRKVPLILVCVAFATLGGLSAVYLFAKIGSPIYLLRHQYLVNTLLQGFGYPYWGAQFLIFAFLLAYAHKLRWSTVVGALGVLALAVFVVIGRRWNLLTFLLPAVVLHHYSKRPLRRLQLAIGASCLIVLFNVAFLLRFAGAHTQRWSELPHYAAQVLKQGYFAAVMNRGSEYKLLDATMVVVRDYPTWREYEYGKSLMAVPLMPLPRSVFPDKPVPYDQELADRLQPGREAGLPAMSFGRLYMDLGILGVVVGMFAAGVAARVMYNYCRANQHDRGVLLLYSLSLLFLLDFIRVADYARTFATALRLAGPLIVALLIITGSPVRRTSSLTTAT